MTASRGTTEHPCVGCGATVTIAGWTDQPVRCQTCLTAPPMVGPDVWHLAVCLDCTPVLEQPFSEARERARWVEAHRGATGHRVTVHDVRKGGGSGDVQQS